MKRILLISTVALSMTLASCDSYLDINEDPNSPSVDNIETGMLMPAIEMNGRQAMAISCALPVAIMHSSMPN